ncbi:unnamed protein product, partial [Amoebophrya sp. A120]
ELQGQLQPQRGQTNIGNCKKSGATNTEECHRHARDSKNKKSSKNYCKQSTATNKHGSSTTRHLNCRNSRHDRYKNQATCSVIGKLGRCMQDWRGLLVCFYMVVMMHLKSMVVLHRAVVSASATSVPLSSATVVQHSSGLENVAFLQGPSWRLDVDLVENKGRNYGIKNHPQDDHHLHDGAQHNSGINIKDVTRVDEEMLIDANLETTWRKLTFEPELVIGLTSVFRVSGGGDYLFLTVSRIFTDAFNPARTVLVVALTDVENVSWVIETRLRLIRAFPQYYKNGNLHIVVPPRRFYPHPWFFIKHKYKDDDKRAKWRTKQNYDVSFLLLYCSYAPESAKWFLMLEDDIATKPKFDEKVLKYLSNRRTDFIHAQFTYLGLIGKLYPMETILLFSKYLFHFAEEQPVDWLIWIFFEMVTQYPVTPRIVQESYEELRSDFATVQSMPRHTMLGQRIAFVPKCNVNYSVVQNLPHLTAKEVDLQGMESGFQSTYGSAMTDLSVKFPEAAKAVDPSILDDAPYLEPRCIRHTYSIKFEAGCNTGKDAKCSHLRFKLGDGTGPNQARESVTGITTIFSNPPNVHVKIYGTVNPNDCNNSGAGTGSLPKQLLFQHHKNWKARSWTGYVELNCLVLVWTGLQSAPFKLKVMLYRSKHVPAYSGNSPQVSQKVNYELHKLKETGLVAAYPEKRVLYSTTQARQFFRAQNQYYLNQMLAGSGGKMPVVYG